MLQPVLGDVELVRDHARTDLELLGGLDVLVAGGVAGVDHVQDQVRVDRLLQGRGERLDQLVRQNPISVEAFSAYVTMNARFHALLNELSASAPPPAE